VISNSNDADRATLEHQGFSPQWTKIIQLNDSSLLPAYLNRADVLVHTRPDTQDNLNVQSKLGLYLASGKPIVTTNVGDYPFILSSSKGCILVDPEESQIAQAIAEAISNPEVATYAQSDNPPLASKYFDSRNNVNMLISLYKSLCSMS
jgi:glycosyltransferase involved in cell wall biosynthesis